MNLEEKLQTTQNEQLFSGSHEKDGRQRQAQELKIWN